MNLEDYVITIRFDKNIEPYFTVTKKGEPHKCNDEELRAVSKTLDVIRRRIDFITDEGNVITIDMVDTGMFKCNSFRVNNGCVWCNLGQRCVPNDDKTDCKRTGCPVRFNTKRQKQ